MKFLPLVYSAIMRKLVRAILTLLSVVMAFTLFGLTIGLNATFNAIDETSRADRIYVNPRFGDPLPVAMVSRMSAIPGVAQVGAVGGLFGYHALYFLALRFAPPAEAGLLNYLWPLLIVMFSSLLPGERLAAHHIVGALLGLAGTVLLFAGHGGAGLTPDQVPGLIAAFVAAFVWSAYSVMSRRLKSVPTDAVAGFCLATALLAAAVHGLVEVTVWPDTPAQWLAIIALGIGPVGAAFYAWDIGMKRGDIRVLGAASYATPLLSTAFLILAGFATPSAGIALAALLIAGGGLIAAKDMLRKR